MNDNAETIIFNMTRGTGLKGLCGIPFKRDNIVRPLLNISREDIERYLELKGQDFITDSTNLSDEYTRNKIRHKALPILTEINGGFLNCIRYMSSNLKIEDDYLDSQAYLHIKDDLRTVHSAIRKRVIIKILSEFDFEISSVLIHRLESALFSTKKVKINIHKDCYALISEGKINIRYLVNDAKSNKIIFGPVITKIGENSFLGDKKVMIFVNNSEIIKKDDNINKKSTKEQLDYDTIQGDILLRNRRNGDEYVRCSRNFHSSLKKLFNAEIPENERDYICILEDDDGIIWVEGFGIADRVKVTENTKRLMNIEVIN